MIRIALIILAIVVSPVFAARNGCLPGKLDPPPDATARYLQLVAHLVEGKRLGTADLDAITESAAPINPLAGMPDTARTLPFRQAFDRLLDEGLEWGKVRDAIAGGAGAREQRAVRANEARVATDWKLAPHELSPEAQKAVVMPRLSVFGSVSGLKLFPTADGRAFALVKADLPLDKQVNWIAYDALNEKAVVVDHFRRGNGAAHEVFAPPGGNALAITSEGDTNYAPRSIKVTDLTTGKSVRTFDLSDIPRGPALGAGHAGAWFCYGPEGQPGVLANWGHGVEGAWLDLATGERRALAPGPHGMDIYVSPDRKRVFAHGVTRGKRSAEVQIRDAMTGEIVFKKEFTDKKRESAQSRMYVNAKGEMFVAVYDNVKHTVETYDVARKQHATFRRARDFHVANPPFFEEKDGSVSIAFSNGPSMVTLLSLSGQGAVVVNVANPVSGLGRSWDDMHLTQLSDGRPVLVIPGKDHVTLADFHAMHSEAFAMERAEDRLLGVAPQKDGRLVGLRTTAEYDDYERVFGGLEPLQLFGPK